MRKMASIITILTCILLTMGCVSGTEKTAKQKIFEQGDYLYEDENLVVLISINKEIATDDYFDFEVFVEFTIENKTEEGISLITDYLSYNFASGKMVKLLPGETKQLHTALSSPPIAIPPHSTIKKIFYFVEASDAARTALKIIISPELDNASLVFGYRKDGKEIVSKVTAADNINVTTFSGYVYRDPNMPLPEYKNKLGEVTAKQKTWNLLFTKSVEKRRKDLYDLATKKAIEQYGSNILLANIRYEGTWNPLSLVLYFSLLGFVEDAKITADVLESP